MQQRKRRAVADRRPRGMPIPRPIFAVLERVEGGEAGGAIGSVDDGFAMARVEERGKDCVGEEGEGEEEEARVDVEKLLGALDVGVAVRLDREGETEGLCDDTTAAELVPDPLVCVEELDATDSSDDAVVVDGTTTVSEELPGGDGAGGDVGHAVCGPNFLTR